MCFFVVLYFFFSVKSKPTLQFKSMSCSSLAVLSKAMGMPGHKLTLHISGLGLLVFVKVWNFSLECLCHDAFGLIKGVWAGFSFLSLSHIFRKVYQ